MAFFNGDFKCSLTILIGSSGAVLVGGGQGGYNGDESSERGGEK